MTNTNFATRRVEEKKHILLVCDASNMPEKKSSFIIPICFIFLTIFLILTGVNKVGPAL